MTAPSPIRVPRRITAFAETSTLSPISTGPILSGVCSGARSLPSIVWSESMMLVRSPIPQSRPMRTPAVACTATARLSTVPPPTSSTDFDFSSTRSRTCTPGPSAIAPPSSCTRHQLSKTTPSPASSRPAAPGETWSTSSRPSRTSRPKRRSSEPPRAATSSRPSSTRGSVWNRGVAAACTLTLMPWRDRRARSSATQRRKRSVRSSAAAALMAPPRYLSRRPPPAGSVPLRRRTPRCPARRRSGCPRRRRRR